MKHFSLLAVEAYKVGEVVGSISGQSFFPVVLLCSHDESVSEGIRFEPDDQVGYVLLGLGVVIVVWTNVVDCCCCVLLVIGVERYPKYAVVSPALVL